MATIRDDEGRLVVNGKVIPKCDEQLYLRREGNKNFPSKSQFDQAQEDSMAGLGQDIVMMGGEVDHLCTMNDKELPAHDECKEPVKVERPEQVIKVEGYPIMGVKLDPGEDAKEEPVEPGPVAE